jgi:hypothetical protein
MDDEFVEEKKSKGFVVIVLDKTKGTVVSRNVNGLNAFEIGQIIAELELVKSDLVNIRRELIKRDNKLE